MDGLPRNAERRQVLGSRAIRNRIGDIGYRLARLPDWNGGDHFVGQGVDRGHPIRVFEPT